MSARGQRANPAGRMKQAELSFLAFRTASDEHGTMKKNVMVKEPGEVTHYRNTLATDEGR